MQEPDLYLVAANDAEREALRNDMTAKAVIFGVILLAYSLSAAVMLSLFWKNLSQRKVLFVVLAVMLLIGIVWFMRVILKYRGIKRGEELLLFTGFITGKKLETGGDSNDAMIAINGREFVVGPEVFHEARIGARIGVREWYHSREFYDYTFDAKRIDAWLARSRKL